MLIAIIVGGGRDNVMMTYFILVFLGLFVIAFGYGAYAATKAGNMAGRGLRKIADKQKAENQAKY